MTFTIRVAHGAFGAGNAPMSMAVEAREFADRGLEVVMEEVSMTSRAVEMIVDDKAEAAVAGAVPLLKAASRGADVVSVMSIEAENVFAVMGKADVRTPEDLRGATVGVAGHGNPDSMVLYRALRDWGLDPVRDVTYQRHASRGELWQALLDGRIAAMAATIPQPLLARKLGLPVLRDFRDTPEPYQAGSIIVRRRFAARFPEQLQQFLAGQLAGVRRFQRDVDAAMPHLRSRSKLDDEDVLRETHALFSHAMNAYVPAVESFASVLRDLREATGEGHDLDPATVIDPSFAERL